MAISKHNLPRHTNLAKHGFRIVAAIFDAAVTLFYFLIIFIFGTNMLFSFTLTNDYRSNLRTWELQSGLLYFDESSGSVIQYKKSESLSYETLEIVTEYYYLNYLTGVEPTIVVPEESPVHLPSTFTPALNCNDMIKDDDGNEVLPKDYYTIAWYNKNVLSIPENPEAETSTSLFTYQKDELGEYDLTKIGVPRNTRYNEKTKEQEAITNTDLRGALYTKYTDAYLNLLDQPYYFAEQTKLNFFTGLAVLIAAIVAGFFSYVFVPLIRKDGATFGKMIFKLGLANIRGYKHRRYQILLRFLPYVLTLTAVTLFPFSSLYLLLLIALVVLLVSFALMMASPKRTALHDLSGQTIVIETKTSKIFETSADEMAYIEVEDGLVPTTLIKDKE